MPSLPQVLWDFAPALSLVFSNFQPQVSPILIHTHTPANLILQPTLNSLFPSLSHSKFSKMAHSMALFLTSQYHSLF